MNSLYITRIVIFLLLFTTFSCSKAPTTIPTGTWHYNLLINGVKVGTAMISNEVRNNTYVYTFELRIKDSLTHSKDVIVETLECKPIRLEKHTYISLPSGEQKLDIIAECNGSTITLIENNVRSTITIENDFVFDGNYFLLQLIKAKFKKGTTITHHIYDPTIEREKTIPVSITLEGTEVISVNNTIYKAFKVNQNIREIKNITVYLDNSGKVLKSSIRMLNMNLDIVLTDTNQTTNKEGIPNEK